MKDMKDMFDELRWFKSSYSGSSATDCVETARASTGMCVRDSKDPGRAMLAFGGSSFSAFLDHVRESELS